MMNLAYEEFTGKVTINRRVKNSPKTHTSHLGTKKQYEIRYYNTGEHHYCIDDTINLDELGFPSEVIDIHDHEIAEDLCSFLNKHGESSEETILMFFRYLVAFSSHYEFYYKTGEKMMEHFKNK